MKCHTVYLTKGPVSVSLSRHSARHCCGSAAERPAGRRHRSTAADTGRPAAVACCSNYYYLFSCLFSRTTWASRYQKGKTSLDLKKARDDGVLGRQWHQLDHMQTICTSPRTGNRTSTSSLNVYRLGALPGAQPTVSEH